MPDPARESRTPAPRLRGDPGEATPSGMTELKVPAQTEFIGLARRVATSLGGLLGFNLEKIDELSIAVTQACGSVIEAATEAWGPGATLRLSFAPTDDGLQVDVDAIAPSSREALKQVPRRPASRDTRAAVEMQRALEMEMIRLFVDDFRHQIDTGRRQIRYRMVKYLVS
jgi:anti-sigma regulatory factor (Ser/Thr protein kinase)